MAEFLIQDTTLMAAADKIREYLGVEKFSFKDGVGSNGVFNTDAVVVYYQEFVDYPGEYGGLDQDVYQGDVFIAYDFAEDNKGVLTPVIYKTDIKGRYPEMPDYEDQYFYVGQVKIGVNLYDKWRKIELAQESLFGWDSQAKKYLYTNVIVNSNTFCPSDFVNKIQEVYDKGYQDGGNGQASLPTLTNEGTAEDLLFGKQLIDGEGKKVVGTIETFDGSYDCSGESTGGSGEDVTEETNTYTSKLASLESAIVALETELAGKASGGSGGGESAGTCTVNISSDYSAFCTIFYQPDATHWTTSEPPRSLTVACNSLMFVYQDGHYKAHVFDGEILHESTSEGFVYKVPNTPNASISISIETD
jgi:hypothetical protein